MRIDLLQSGLPITENPGIDTRDPRFDEIASLVQNGRYIEAAQLCEKTILDGVYDIRLICYFLYGHWLEQGLGSLVSVIDCLNYVLLENIQAIGPIKRREKTIQTSLAWFFKQVLKTIEHEEKKNSPQWQKWKTTFTADDIARILESSEAFRLSVAQQLENTVDSFPEYSRVVNWFRMLQQLVNVPPEPLSTSESIQNTEQTLPLVEDTPVPTVQEKTVAVTTTLQPGTLTVELSYHMAMLLKKLAAFEALIAEENYYRAALLAEDINQSLASFDPFVYFPKTCEAFVRLQALKYEELSAFEGYQGSPQWQVMQQWLKTDLDSFMKN